MKGNNQLSSVLTPTEPKRRGRLRPFALSAGLLAALTQTVMATENVPHAPFAQWANLPEHGQLVLGAFYDESEAYHVWARNDQRDVTWHANGERYGIDINQGYITLQYGITRKWAADLSVGYTTTGWRYFSNASTNGEPQSTSGLMDTAFGVRYQIFDEAQAQSPWMPTLTLRVGAVLPGTFSQGFPFAPGTRSAAVEPEILVRKHFGWTGLGFYGDGLFRWNRTTANDQYILSAGLFQQIKGWELQAGYRHLGTTSGEDIVLSTDRLIYYPVAVRENNDSIEAGFSYTTPKRHWQFGFYSRTVLDGANSDGKFWFGGYVNFPFSLVGKKSE
jgi:hypothetical protein